MLVTQKEVEAALQKSLLFPLLGLAERDAFIARARARSWSAGAPIFTMGDAGDSMLLVLSGEVLISYPAADGRVATLGDVKPGAVFGEIALIDGGPRSATATAATNCALLVFERQEFMAILQRNWPLAEAVLKLVCSRLREADTRMADLAFADLPGRLAKTLLARAKPAPGGGCPLVAETQGALAAMAGGSREAVNRCLRKWQSAGLVVVTAGRISLLDSEGLGRIAKPEPF